MRQAFRILQRVCVILVLAVVLLTPLTVLSEDYKNGCDSPDVAKYLPPLPAGCYPERVISAGELSHNVICRAQYLGQKAWERQVLEKYGERFKRWDLAACPKIECVSGPASGSSRCIFSGFPCSPDSDTRVLTDLEVQEREVGGGRDWLSAKPSPSAAVPPVSAARAGDALPEFPWPPPAASTVYELPKPWFARLETLGEVSDGILAALAKSGYVERSFFRTGNDGVALVTRLERINPDGTPIDPRWPIGFEANPFDLTDFLRGLFFVPTGRYRVIVFVMQDKPFQQSSEKATEAQVRDCLKTGLTNLPPEVAQRSFKTGMCTALVYEFASDGSIVKLVDSELTGLRHLEKAGLVAALEAIEKPQ